MSSRSQGASDASNSAGTIGQTLGSIVCSSPRNLGELGKFLRLGKLGEGWDFRIFWVSLVLLGEVDFPG